MQASHRVEDSDMSFFGGSDLINVIAEIKAKTGSEDVVRAIVTSLVAPSRKESGCKAYYLHEDTKKPGHFYTYEEWTSEAALDDHLAGARQTLDQAKLLLDGELKLTVLKMLT
jgi:quinol monooxygenase YgiN